MKTELPPQGNPYATSCRWCGATKVHQNGGRLCAECDGGISPNPASI